LSKENIVLTPIGFVKTDAVGEEIRDRSRTSKIIVKSEFVQALDGISSYSHLFILFWLNQIKDDERKTLKVHPRGKTDLPLSGVFAVRTMLRPNPIGLTIVEIVDVHNNVLTIKGLDAYNGTPVLDIKPYDPWDVVENPKVPSWWQKLKEEKK
jgi:tRNA-Thr(GGU) m(6)t(6)A37 methyltransferase TsaA